MRHVSRRIFLQSASATMVGAGVAASASIRQWDAYAAETPEMRATSPLPHRESFSFLHTYESTGRYWRGLEKAGLVRSTNGIRLVNSPWGEDSRRFNEVARVGGPLHQILEQRKCHFIVDRVAGGSQYSAYPFDTALIDHYAALLGGKLLGGQVHETISNTHNDWGRFVKADKRFATEPIRPEDLRKYFTESDAEHWLEYGTLEDYAGRVHFNSQATLWQEIERLGKKQAGRFQSRFSYCEGSHYGKLVWHIFYRFGAGYCVAEVGPWASNHTQFAIASLRGAAKAAGKPWGVFFAPWGPQGCTCFIPPAESTWRVPEKMLLDSGWPVGPQYGCSTAMQRRIFFHAYMAGAHTLHEEWGAEDNLLHWDTGELSSYGRVTRDFLDFQDAFPDVGEPYTPIALVLDASVPPPDETAWKTIWDPLFQYGATDTANAERKDSGKAETACYPPCALPELFDVVPSDATAEVWKDYQDIIPIGSAPLPSGVKACPAESAYGRLTQAVAQRSPLARATHLPMQINRRRSDGAWIVALYNPWGAARGDVDNVGSILNEECAIHDVLRPTSAVKSVRTIHAWPQSSTASLQGGAIHVTVGPGGVLIFEMAGS